MSEHLPDVDELPRGWISLSEAFGWIADRVMVKAPEFVVKHWDCKYINARIDMRTGKVSLMPGNARTTETTGEGTP